MRFILLLSFLACCAATPVTETHDAERALRILNDKLLAALEKIRELIKTGDADKNIPVLDPFKMDTIALNTSTNLLSFNLKAAGIQLNGLSDFSVSTVDMTLLPPGLKFELNLPMSVLQTSSYSFNGLVFNALPIYGNGNTYFEVGNLNIGGHAKVTIKGNSVIVKSLDLNINLGSLMSETTGMLGGGDIDNVVNALLGDMAHDFFNANSAAISKVINDMTLDKINAALEGVSLGDIIDIVTGKD